MKKLSILSLVLLLSIILITADIFATGISLTGVGGRASVFGGAFRGLANDWSAAYWNPAGLAYMKQSEAQFLYQPWLVDINSAFVGVGLVLPRIGTIAVSIFQVGYGDMEVTNLQMQDGTGELFTASDYSINISFGRRLAEWFAFGASGKYRRPI